ncbi:FAD/NAD(P)-binding protein, partial [Kitasatospora sp. NPDC018614]
MTHVLAVVGGGPRATYALERLSAQLDRLGPGQRLKVLVFERSGEFGAGQAHSPSQPATSFLNRVSSQVSFAADETTTGAGPLRTSRRTLHEWCRERYARTGEPDLDLGPADWPRRYVHGLALREAFDSYAADLRAHPRAELELHHAEVVRLRAGRRLLLQTADGRRFEADQALLVTGHTHHDPLRGEPSRSRARFAAATGCHYVPYAYPLDRLPEETGTVGVAGTGLTAIDVILHLTEGRGGRFEPVAGGLRYVPSGAEPRRVVAFSGSGLFTFCRADDEKGDRAHQGVHLTTEAIDRLRERHPEGLDFERDVLPLIEREMAYLYEAAGGGSFDFARTVDPLASAGAHTPEAYRKAVLDFMELDQRRAEEGNVTNPHKAAADGV